MNNPTTTMSFRTPVPEAPGSSSAWVQTISWWSASIICAAAAWAVGSGEFAKCLVGVPAFIVAVGLLSFSNQRAASQSKQLCFVGAYALLFAFAADAGTAVWHVPKSLADLTKVSSFGAALFLLLYFGLIAASHRGRKTGLSLMESISLAAIPFLFGWLLLLASPQIPAELTALPRALQIGPQTSDILARALIILVFNTAVVALLTSLTARHWVLRKELLGLALGSSLYTALTPSIADFGPLHASGLPVPVQTLIAIATGVLAQAGLWGQTFFVTGIFMDALDRRQPSYTRARMHFRQGCFRGGMYTFIFLTTVQAASFFIAAPLVKQLAAKQTLYFGLLLGAVVFPLLRTIVESFDGSEPFLRRLSRNHAAPLNYLRGAAFGLGIAAAWQWNLHAGSPWIRAGWGLLVGVAAYSGINIIRDIFEILRRHRQRLQPINVYAVELALGGFTGLAIGWYADANQLGVLAIKFFRYAALSMSPHEAYEVYPLFSKWGAIDLGAVLGGTRLLFNESVSGVIGWSLAAPLFSLNLVLLTAVLRRATYPLRELFTAAGFSKVISETLRVERWGLWMAPVIYTFLRMASEPAWYNQDGAVRSAVATIMSLVLGESQFHKWSLELFTSMLVLDWLRILIWFDHMGLRVATLVNLSFIGGDLLDEKAARVMGHSAPSRVIPEGLRRFGTWMPILIPFYIPRGGDWDYAWGTAEKAAAAGNQGGISAAAFVCGFFAIISTIAVARNHKQRPAAAPSSRETWARRTMRLSNGHYTLELAADGRGWSRVFRTPEGRDEIDLTRKPDSPYAVSGKALYIVEKTGTQQNIWSLLKAPCNTPDAAYTAVVHPKSVHYLCERGGIRSEIDASVHHEEHLEYWRIRLINQSRQPRELTLITYRDLVLNGTGISQRHPSFNDLHVSTCFIPQLQGIFASNRLLLNKQRKPGEETFFHAAGPLPPAVKLVGYRDAKSRILGSGSERLPLGLLEAPRPLEDFGQLYTFDPAASLQFKISLEPGRHVDLVVADGWARTLQAAGERLSRCLDTPRISIHTLHSTAAKQRAIEPPALEVLTKPKPWHFSDNGKQVFVTEHTPRIWAHPIANAQGYGLLATNEAAIFSFAANAQQNPITPFALGTSSGITPGQAWHLWDLDADAPVLHLPRRLDVKSPQHSPDFLSEFGQGYVKYTMHNPKIALELTAFVLPDQPAEGRILKLKNLSERTLNLRLACCFQISLAEVPNDSRNGLLATWNPGQQTFLFENPSQQFRRGPAFVAPGFPIESAETLYRHFVGRGRSPDFPVLAERGRPDTGIPDDGYKAASFSTVFALGPGEEMQFCVTLGQADTVADALALANTMRSPAQQAAELERTKRWWEEFLGVLRVETADPGFDRLVNDWLPYQVVASRLWGRTGAYQRSGAFGFRDQLQDVIPLASIHPEICRKQILLHAAQQFREGDTMQWWHTTWEGKTGIGARNRASDVMLWLPHVVKKYLDITGDRAILDEQVGFLEGMQIPAEQEGIVFAPRDTQDTETLYEHCRRAIEWSLAALGEHGLPKMGAGDWNDGLDRVGPHGSGESVWLGFFLHGVLSDFSEISAGRGDVETGERYHGLAINLRNALDKTWRETRFLRATMDDGTELAFDDALTSAWPIISRAVDPVVGAAALSHGLDSLERETIMVLLAPAFTETSRPYPGRIAVYPPGVRENGGQYSHGCSWLVDAALDLADRLEKDGDPKAAQAWRERGAATWKKISPLSQTTDTQWERYGLEPHQQPADIYYGTGYEGRGGWSWYTGSGGRMLSAAWKLLGIECSGQNIELPQWAKERQGWPQLKAVTYRGKKVL